MDNIDLEFLDGILSDDEDEVVVFERIFRERRPRTIRVRINHFESWDETNFFERFRIHKNTANFLIEMIQDEIVSRTQRNHALSPADKVLLTLRFYATGSFLITVGDLSGVSKSTVSRAVKQVSEAFARRAKDFIKFPENIQEVHSGFFSIAKFPKCAGAVDCTHIKIQTPGGPNAEDFRNRKHFFSLNVQSVTDANLKMCDIVVRWPGRAHDSYIFKNSRVRERLESGEFGPNSVFVGDSGYALSNTLITPLANPSTRGEILFQESQIRTRNPVERLFGVWKRRFPVLALGIRLNLATVEAVIMATAMVHNIARDMGEDVPDVTEEELEAIAATESVPQRPAAAPGRGRGRGRGRGMGMGTNEVRRNTLIRYFSGLT